MYLRPAGLDGTHNNARTQVMHDVSKVRVTKFRVTHMSHMPFIECRVEFAVEPRCGTCAQSMPADHVVISMTSIILNHR
eukprot:scaffold69373_cov18-Prasinocladus_malaysianus.AAC.2